MDRLSDINNITKSVSTSEKATVLQKSIRKRTGPAFSKVFSSLATEHGECTENAQENRKITIHNSQLGDLRWSPYIKTEIITCSYAYPISVILEANTRSLS